MCESTFQVSAFCSPYIEVSLPPTCPLPKRGNSCRHLTTDSLNSEETFPPPKHFLLKFYFSVTFDPSPTTVNRAQTEKVTPAPISAPGDVHLREGKRKGGPPGGGFRGSSRLPTMGREGAPVGEEVGRERVRAGIADDLLSEPKDVLSPGLIPVPLLASSARVCATPLAAGLEPQRRPGPQPLSFLLQVLSPCAPLLPLLFLPPGLIPEPAWVGVFFLGPHACTCT